MKKILLLTMITIVLALAAACGATNETNEEGTDTGGEGGNEKINLRLNAGLSNEDFNTKAFTTPWMEQVEEKTDGQVTFDSFFSEELVPMGEEIRALQDGTIDLAAPILPTYQPDQFPLSDVTMLPLLESDALIAAKAFADLIKSDVELQDGKTFTDLEYGKHGMKALPVQPVAQYTIGAVKGHEFKTAADFKNLSLRTGGRAHEIFVKELGSGPVSMPWSEEFEALSRGALNGNVRSVQDYGPYGFDELIRISIEDLAIGHFPLVWLMTEEKWNNLPENVQTVMEETAYELSESTVKLEAHQEAIEDAKSKGIQFVKLSDLDPDAQELLEQASVNTWKAWIDSKEAEGLPGLETAKLWRDLILKHGGKVHDPIMELE